MNWHVILIYNTSIMSDLIGLSDNNELFFKSIKLLNIVYKN